MTNELFVKIVVAVATIIISLITAYVVPFVKSKFTGSQLEQFTYYVTLAVRSAEQIYKVEDWELKKKYVYEYAVDVLNSKLHIKLSPADIDAIIEGIVNEVKHK